MPAAGELLQSALGETRSERLPPGVSSRVLEPSLSQCRLKTLHRKKGAKALKLPISRVAEELGFSLRMLSVRLGKLEFVLQ